MSQSVNHEVKSAKNGDELPPKCKNCTLEEVAVLRIVQKKLSATQKEIAAGTNRQVNYHCLAGKEHSAESKQQA